MELNRPKIKENIKNKQKSEKTCLQKLASMFFFACLLLCLENKKIGLPKKGYFHIKTYFF